MSTVTEHEIEQAVTAFVAEASLNADEIESNRGKVFDAGFARVEFAEGFGGRGWPRSAQASVDKLLKQLAGFEPLSMWESPIGIGMAAPTINSHARESIKASMLRKIFTGEAVWCQMYSEPAAGSDVASLATRAVREGDEWVITGQKIWTSYAHEADYGMILVRTDPKLPKHQGITCFIVDMHDPAIEVRPLYQVHGGADFNEVFLNGVRVADEFMLGAEGEGWKVANTTLMNERDAIGGLTSFTESTISKWHAVKEDLGDSRESLKEDLVKLWIEDIAIAVTSQAARKKAASGKPGPEGSVAKQAGAELQQKIAKFELELEGANALVIPEGYPFSRGKPEVSSANRWYLSSLSYTIAGGTSEVMRNILAERVLRMPSEPRTDKDVPWDETLRG